MIPTRHRTASPRRPRLTARLAALGAATALAATAVSTVGPGTAPANAAETPAAALTVRLDPSYQHPAFQGWGTALAWFANVTGGWPDAQRDTLADALYGADGLGFTIARYNIGGGDSPETAPYMRPGAAVPGYWNRPGPEAPDWWDPNRADHWNAGADANQRWWLTAAKARGATTFEAFSNSAPYFMTNSGLASGAVDGWRDNLRSDQYDRFAAYLTGALQRAQSATGVAFDSVSPVNEPDTDYWHAGGRQEGSHWDPASQARMITTLRAALDAKGVTTPIAGMDETNPGKFRSDWESYAPAVRDAVGRLNTHTYGTNGRTGVRDIAKTGKALSVSNGTLTFASPGSSTAQQWIRSTTGDGHSTLINAASGRLLDVTGASTADGAPVGVHQPTTGGNQSWALISTAPDVWKSLSFRHSSKCLDVSGGGTNDGAAVVQYGCTTGSNQQWSLRSTGGGYVNVVARHSGKCLDVSGQSTADAAEVFQYSCNGGRNQEWAVRATADGHLTLTARHSAKCLSVSGASTADGAAAVQRTCDGTAAQQLS